MSVLIIILYVQNQTEAQRTRGMTNQGNDQWKRPGFLKNPFSAPPVSTIFRRDVQTTSIVEFFPENKSYDIKKVVHFQRKTISNAKKRDWMSG